MIQQLVAAATQARHPDPIVTPFGMVRLGMDVWSHDGKIGRVVLIVRDRHTQDPSHLVVQCGWFWGRHLLIPLHWTIKVVDNRINLNLRKAQIIHLAEYRSDEQIARKVQAAIYSSSSFMPSGDCATIKVLVQHGVVTLRGNVRDRARSFAAQAIANSIQGVQELRNELVADDELKRLVERKITHDPVLTTLDLLVTVHLGLVEIGGYVPADSLREQLITHVRQVAGVRAIWNKVVVDVAADRQGQALQAGPVPQDPRQLTCRAETVSTVST
jgi:osmotically-inducible protein OsmY